MYMRMMAILPYECNMNLQCQLDLRCFLVVLCRHLPAHSACMTGMSCSAKLQSCEWC